MQSKEQQKKEVIRTLGTKISKLPVGFIVGAVIGGGLLLYSTRKSTKLSALTNVAKLVAPYVIITILDKIVENYDENSQINIETAEAEII